MEIKDIEEVEETHGFVAAAIDCAGSGTWGPHDYCDECDSCGHPRCEFYAEEHYGKGLREEETPAPGALGSSLRPKPGKVKFVVGGYDNFKTEHVGQLVRIIGEKVFHVCVEPSGTIQIYYCGKIDRVEKE